MSTRRSKPHAGIDRRLPPLEDHVHGGLAGVFEALAGGPADPSALAARLGTGSGSLERLLDACVAMGLLAKRNGGYANQPVAETYLCDHSPLSLTGYVLYSNEAFSPCGRTSRTQCAKARIAGRKRSAGTARCSTTSSRPMRGGEPFCAGCMALDN